MTASAALLSSSANLFPWFVLFTIPHHERNVVSNLSKSGIEGFVPLRNEVRDWSDRKKKIVVPYFPNYVFVRIARTDRFRVFATPGILRFLDSNQNPTEVRNEEIAVLKQLQDSGRVVGVTNDLFREGDRVKITSGPLKNLNGILLENRGSRRLLIEIESINKGVVVEWHECKLEKVRVSIGTTV